MTVAELIAELGKFPADWPVQVPEIGMPNTEDVASVAEDVFTPGIVQIRGY